MQLVSTMYMKSWINYCFVGYVGVLKLDMIIGEILVTCLYKFKKQVYDFLRPLYRILYNYSAKSNLRFFLGQTLRKMFHKAHNDLIKAIHL